MGEDGLEERVEELENRVEELEKRRRPPGTGVEVGDLITVVIEDPNSDSDRDPVTHIDGMATFVKDPAGQLEFGDTAQVKISDIQDTQMVAVSME